MNNQRDTESGYEEFIHLFNTYKVPVYFYIQAIVNDAYMAEELTQELFIRLWNKRSDYSTIANKDQYIFRMAHNACMSWFQKLALNARLAKEVKQRMEMEQNNVEDHMALQEARKLLEEALQTLSVQRRKVFELSRKEGLKLPEIAERLGISHHTANHHLVAALSHIREYFLKQSRDKALLLLIFAFLH